MLAASSIQDWAKLDPCPLCAPGGDRLPSLCLHFQKGETVKKMREEVSVLYSR